MEQDNLTKQIDEVEALTAIYGDDFVIDSEELRSYTVKIKDNNNEVLLSVTMPAEYPSEAPPKYEFSAPWMDRKAKESLRHSLDEVYLENLGETNPVIEETLDLSQLEINCPDITHGDVIIDRKSSFQGHAAEVHGINDVNAVLIKLKQNKKIQNATHNMYAYRIEKKTDKGITILQDCDDDGETHAGGRMLHLLQILDQKNTIVVVSRWYGGIQLGPDRFRHINNATRQAIQQAGLLKK
ncbi:unnamed protein product [Leptosia nina]|uniref:RWD domain-containing protein n=1 Tax=Leptosia nina TaxID=320188 RepID=A0AAV1JEP9_9NEOP